MKKTLISGLLALFCFSASLSAFSWSGLIGNESKFSENSDFSSLSLSQTNNLYLSFATFIGDSKNMKLTGEGLFKNSLAAVLTPEADTADTPIVDCDLFKFSGNWSIGRGLLSLDLGRFRISDFSAAVFSQVSDGLNLSYSNLYLKLGLYAGYTGLLNRLNVSMVENEYDDSKFYALCPAYIPVLFDFSYKTLFETNTIGFQGSFFVPVDMEKNTMKAYGTLSLSGPLSTFGTYSVMGTFGTEKFESFMLDAKADINVYIGTVGMVNAGYEYISDESESLHGFKTISARSLYNGALTSGLMIPKLSFILAKNSVYFSLTEKVIISNIAVETELNGFDTSLSLIGNILSDVQLGLDAGAFISVKDENQNNYYMTLKASLAF